MHMYSINSLCQEVTIKYGAPTKRHPTKRLLAQNVTSTKRHPTKHHPQNVTPQNVTWHKTSATKHHLPQNITRP